MEPDSSVVASYMDFFEILVSHLGTWMLGPTKIKVY